MFVRKLSSRCPEWFPDADGYHPLQNARIKWNVAKTGTPGVLAPEPPVEDEHYAPNWLGTTVPWTMLAESPDYDDVVDVLVACIRDSTKEIELCFVRSVRLSRMGVHGKCHF